MRKLHTVAAIALSLNLVSVAAAETLVLPTGATVPDGSRLLADYGSFRLVEGELARAPAGAWELDGSHLLRFDRLAVDTRRASFDLPAGFSDAHPVGSALQIVQFVGPVKDAWLDRVRATGALPIQYIETDGYLLWADASARARLDALAQSGDVLQFSRPLPGFLKLGNSLFERIRNAAGQQAASRVPIIVQRFRHGEDTPGRERVAALGLKPDNDWTPQLGHEVARFSANLDQVRGLIELPDVVWVGEYFEPTLNDEVQAQVIRGHLNADASAPLGPGYRAWLESLGFPTDANAYPILDITDDGIGNRTTQTGDPTFHRFGDAGLPTRMVYNQACTGDNGVVGGHGHINANIALGYDVRENASTPGARFPGEYQRGQGLNPFGRLGGTRLFAPNFDLSACNGSNLGVIAANYAAGARIASNSWGCGPCAGQYDVASQAYDIGTRDADPVAEGNQQLITVFSAGNDGSTAGTVGSPGNGKNMITVGASENARPQDEGGPWNDGCQIGPDGADNVMDVIFFSSRGPAPGGRVKPDLVAPGTHVTGTQPDPGNGIGICDPVRPFGNATYAAASGTSHAAPAVSAVASLSWWWIATGQGSLQFHGPAPSEPSPALTKAWLIAHPTWLTGEGANDDLPSNAQGYGMPNLGDLFSDVPKWLLDQDEVLGDSGQVWTAQFQAALPLAPVRIVLAWTDAPGSVGTSPQVNNLDLSVTRGGTTWRGNRFSGPWSTPGGNPDTANNVEAVFLPDGTTEPFTVEVRGFNIGGDGVPGNADVTDQDFALVCSNCAQEPTFVLGLKPERQSACTSQTGSLSWTISTLPVLAFGTPADLALASAPPGSSSAFSVNPLPMSANSILTLSGLAGVAPGSHAIAVRGHAAGIQRTRYSRLDLFDQVPGGFSLLAPAAKAVNVGRRPLFDWQGASQADRYRLEIALDPDFENIVHAIETEATSHDLQADLEYETRYYWRVTAINDCGSSPSVATASFVTTPVPGECAEGTAAQAVLASDFEDGAGAWTGSGSHNTWAISSARSRSGSKAWLAQDVPFRSDQRLTSPAIALPVGQEPLILEFWTHQTLENRIGGCYDGALLEISSDAGGNWTQVSDSMLAVGRYDGPISTSFNNPAGGRQAWCGDPRDWSRSVVTLDAYAGATVQFRFRLATDASTGRLPDGFYLDDFLVQSCVGAQDAIFANGFDMP
jgi:hypothetical protein